ncbi:peptidoglycan bridge formation glycyltransferase FemA/FemB family protein [Nocardioides sp. zg-536]|uniref:Peptidoglycan bridge formation glycyltransferase FemA/FemB family protein n=1 Tax=Nocardioides faecalis TaxID=2803858 RepID=A0A938Y4P4_9ACTN|nr:peptidoglycan bridge formation glycyltransferase FemA/FemB family protein [Nocardioides faecalis]MBM9459963.1 peptidoglycan bridge formation glycyltransferase FemA/FemB family protein [Nocardioides faecalis]MBS4753167.1 peptidoglycan bridge formation glycyltransferase FemA/FemB family protein [Nocardioides faecalis]QVI58813.1 peptidoglycan bridge formation glycyltransferase FemA/FemB family protein [Nocardioides faecalis]
MPSVRPISPTEHREHLATLPSASFLQTPGWGKVKSEWRSESLGWFDDAGDLVGVGLVLYRKLPRLKRYLAYLPEGPIIDWTGDDLAGWLDPMVAHLRKQGAFAVRIGPPVVTRRWSTAQIKEGIADPEVHLLSQVPPVDRSVKGARTVAQLHELGWRYQGVVGGFAAGQPQFVFQVPLRNADGTPRTEDEVLKGMNQLWRRNIKRAAKEGVEVTVGTREDLPAFHELYVHTAQRDHFTPRPLRYFETMHDALLEDSDEPDRFRLWLARHDGDLVASTISIRVGEHSWYSYGASSTEKREVRGSNAVQWAMIRDAIAAGAAVYDLRGITETLDADDSHVGLIQFKVGTGGEAVEYAGEWDLPINRPLYRAFQLYLARRG